MRNNTCKRKKPRPFWATLRQSANLFQDATAAKRRNLEEAGNHRLFVSRENSTQKPLKNEKYPKVETWNFQALHDEMRYVEDADVCCFFLGFTEKPLGTEPGSHDFERSICAENG